VRPLLKKASLDPKVFKNYRPVSNLGFISKILEKIVASRIKFHVESQHLLPPWQSAYRAFHSTETALLKIQNDLLMTLNQKRIAALILLDLSAAFDTIDHGILLRRLHDYFKITGQALNWIKSYLSNRVQYVKIDNNSSKGINIEYGVPQGSVLGPLLFSLYTAPIADIAKKYNVSQHYYADDTQIYIGFNFAEQHQAMLSLESCIHDIKRWMLLNMLKLNDDKTEFIYIGSPYYINKLKHNPVKIGDSIIHDTSSVKNLGVIFDSNLKMNLFVVQKFSSCMYYIKSISKIRRYLTQDATKLLVHAFITSRLDYCNSLLYGINKKLMSRLQHVQNMAARLILCLPRHEHITKHLRELHWLPVEKRIWFKILTIVFKTKINKAPSYIIDLIPTNFHNTYYNLRKNNQNQLSCLVKPKSSFGDRCFSNAAAKLWNFLPLHVKETQSLAKFKKCLKTYLFNL
jgi:hypothetical protein